MILVDMNLQGHVLQFLCRLFFVHAIRGFGNLDFPTKAPSRNSFSNDTSETLYTSLVLFYMKNELGQTIFARDVLNIGDRIRFVLSLDTTGAYGSLRVENCQFTDAAPSSDQDGTTVSVLENSCPVAEQDFLTMDNTWRRHYDLFNELSTGLVTLQGIGRARTLYFQCAVRICLKKSPDVCREVTCGTWQPMNDEKPEVPMAVQHRPFKIVMSQNVIKVTQEIKLAPGPSLEKSAKKAALYTVIPVVTLTLALSGALLSILYYRLRSRRNRPRRFMRSFSRPTTLFARKRNSSLSSSRRNLPANMPESKV